MNTLESSATVIKSALDRYVVALLASPDDPQRIMGAVNELQGAIKGFVALSIQSNGWGNPFVALDEPSTISTERGNGGSNDVVHVDAHYAVRVVDLLALSRFVANSYSATNREAVKEIDPPAVHVHELFTRDGWDPYKYQQNGLEVLEMKWAVYPSGDH